MTKKQVERKLSVYFTLNAYLRSGNETYLMALIEEPRAVDLTEEQIASVDAMALGFHKWASKEQFHARLSQLREVELVGKRGRSSRPVGVASERGIAIHHLYAFYDVAAKLPRIQEVAKPSGWRLIEMRLTPKVRKRRDDFGRWFEVAETESFGRLNREAAYSTLENFARAYYRALGRVFDANIL